MKRAITYASSVTVSVAEGLSGDQVDRRFEEYGRNSPSPPRPRTFQKYSSYFLQGSGPIHLVESTLAGFNMFQDWSSSRVMSSLKNMLPQDSIVIRDDVRVSLPAPELVPGDIAYVKAGGKLPADMRFLQVSGDAKFDRSILTGELLPLAATVGPTDDNYLETRCIGLQGTHCVSGPCTGLVVATGDRTVFARITALTNEPKVSMTPLEREVLRFVLLICGLMITTITVVLILWGTWLRGEYPNWIDVPALMVTCVSVAIAFMPGGLPIAVTAGLTITANLMRKHKVICKSLKTVETLGSVTLLCSDRTGTLTQNQMELSEYAVGIRTISIDAAEDGPEGSTALAVAGIVTAGVDQLHSLARLCNAAEFDATTMNLPPKKRRVFGDATGQAVLRFSERFGSMQQLRQGWQKTYEFAFNSKNKFMVKTFSLLRLDCMKTTVSEREAEEMRIGDTLLTIKGAPDVLIGSCPSFVSNRGVVSPFDDNTGAAFEAVKNSYSSQGKCCLLLARKILRQKELRNRSGTGQFEDEMDEHAKSGLTLVGMVAIVDPLRPEIREVISTLRGTGIRVCMVTGDFALTALSIAQDAGIVSNPPSHVRDLLNLNEHQWKALTEYDEVLFARTTPEQKLRIVREFQAGGVAADIGISLGSGADVAIEAADIVLLDSFSSIVVAVQYGQFWPVMTNVAFGLPQILLFFLVVIACCLIDCAAATALSYEKPEADVLLRKPRDVKKDYYTAKLNEASSIYFVNLVVMQCFNLLGVRTRRWSIFHHPPAFNKATQNIYLFPAIAFALTTAIIWLYIPQAQQILGTSSVPIEHWFLPFTFGLFLLLVDEGRRLLIRRNPNGTMAKLSW
ncbi:calcium ATPase [Durotheca rogersii]|uniref:calcium ATPase n=1 Tax=Durotheca rogersii TaxID=419775 RepID=UPI00221F73C5|nr:calcium ATPase [Durotheca rogersii]KAI5860871.1 calcium ATPase [Durotheca rogersii]